MLAVLIFIFITATAYANIDNSAPSHISQDNQRIQHITSVISQSKPAVTQRLGHREGFSKGALCGWYIHMLWSAKRSYSYF